MCGCVCVCSMRICVGTDVFTWVHNYLMAGHFVFALILEHFQEC